MYHKLANDNEEKSENNTYIKQKNTTKRHNITLVPKILPKIEEKKNVDIYMKKKKAVH